MNEEISGVKEKTVANPGDGLAFHRFFNQNETLTIAKVSRDHR